MSFLKNNSMLCFFLVLFFITIFSLFFFKNHNDVFVDADNVDIAKIDVRYFVMHQMKKDIIDTLIEGKDATQYKDYEIFKNVTLSRMLENNLSESIHSNYVHRNKDIYSFYDGVDYKRNDGFSFYSQAGVLNLSREIFKGKGNFSLYGQQGKVLGENIVYDRKNSMIFAQKIHSKILLEDGK
ncbi:hypothetical protein CQA57_05440 [Helicobacter anseris]|uniref:LPS export ABC transporter periplasmic protein LptC n=1 Tax=Helicobacter anseris TaxID=375926 RepID=A0A3D8J8L8_9HELI|nr:hypothetical protein [Helicobacter anseris]RDU73214.1 hypothetical protein CQA57_05440 [Helicobacter anseris]